jgi:transposase
MSKNILKVFHLQDSGYSLLGWEVQEDEIFLRLKPGNAALCPRCGNTSDRPHEKGKWRKIYHGFGFGRKVYLLVRKERYFCPSCRRPFTVKIPLVSPWQRRTEEAERQIIESLRGQSFRSLSQKEGINYGVSKRILMKRLNPEELLWTGSGEEISIGIDAHSFRGTQMVNTVKDICAHSPLTILPDSRKETLSRFLGNIPEERKCKIKEVCIDMDNLLLSCTEKHLPQASVVVDHFHVIQDANRRVDEARKIEQDALKVEIPRKIFLVGKEKLTPSQRKRIESYFQKYPSLKEFYWMKEALRRFYRLKHKKTAEKRLKDLIAMARLSDDAAMMQWGRTLKRWGPYILNYFDNRTTNAYTEGIHTKIKMIKRVSFGFRNVDVYVRKVLLSLFPLATILSLPHFLS